MTLTQKQRDELWGEDGPYSQASIIIQTRILDDKASRVFVEVEADINPFTYKVVIQNREKFKDNMKIQQLIAHADYRGQKFGYVVCAFSREYTDESVMEEAKEVLTYTKETLITMHRFVMELIE